jgi:ankyrin repeat protein
VGGGADDVDDAVPAPAANRAPEMWGGVTALVFAARQGDIESAKLMLEHGADVNEATEGGWTPLLTSVQNRYYKFAAFLLDRGADPKLQNKGGWSPLYLATDNRNIEGGDYPTRKPDMDHLEIVKLLLARGADVNTRMHSSTETRTIFTHQWLFEEGATPFLRAAQSSDIPLLKLLLEHGADPKLYTDDGTTALMVAAGIGWVEGVTYEWSKAANLETVKMLLDLGVDVNTHNAEGRTALMGAAHKGRNDVVQLLVDRGADLNGHDIGSRDTIHKLAGVNWRAIDYADGLVRVGVQSAIPHPETSALLRKLMVDRGLPVPPEGRTLESICITDICKPEG